MAALPYWLDPDEDLTMPFVDTRPFSKQIATVRQALTLHMERLAEETVRARLIELGWRPPTTGAEHKPNADQTVAVATDVFWNEDMTTCPRGMKVQLLGEGGVAAYGTYHGDRFWVGWAPVPKRRKP